MKGNRAGYNREYAAAVLIEALFSSDDEACKRHGCTIRSLQNYRKRLSTDPELVEVFAKKKELFDQAWADRLPVALCKSLEFLTEAADEARRDPTYRKNPAVIQAIAGSMKLIADVLLTSKIINARLANPDRPTNGIPEQVPSGERPIEYEN